MARLALDFRQVFNKDVVIDIVCYRKYGHNEGDEPGYTQPLMYAEIEAQALGAQALPRAPAPPRRADPRGRRGRARRLPRQARPRLRGDAGSVAEAAPRRARRLARASARPTRRSTRPRRCDDLRRVVTARLDDARRLPRRTRSSARLLARRAELFDKRPDRLGLRRGARLRHAPARRHPVRLSGQDSRRGTFTQRHAVLYDHDDARNATSRSTTSERTPQARFQVYDSLLSEFAVLGFEYGYTVADPDALVLWEAQFGDFVNGAQIIIDQFIVRRARPSGARPVAPRDAAAARLRGAGPRALVGPPRALPAARAPRTTSSWPTTRRRPTTSTRCAAR